MTSMYEPTYVIAAYGTGGVGATTIAVNLASLIAADVNRYFRYSRHVVLVDADWQYGNIDVHMNMEAHEFSSDSELSPDALEALIQTHESGLKVLPAPMDFADIEDRDIGETLRRILGDSYIIIIDAGRELNARTIGLLDSADCIIAVTRPLQTDVLRFRKFLTLVESQFPYCREKLLYVINGIHEDMHGQGYMPVKTIEKGLKITFDVQISAFPTATLNRDIRKGRPMILKERRELFERSRFDETVLEPFGALAKAVGEKLSTPREHASYQFNYDWKPASMRVRFPTPPSPYLTSLSPPIGIVLVLETIRWRGVLQSVLKFEPDLNVVGVTNVANEALGLASKLDAEIVLISVDQSDISHLALVKNMRDARPQMGIILMAEKWEDELLTQARQAGADKCFVGDDVMDNSDPLYISLREIATHVRRR